MTRFSSAALIYPLPSLSKTLKPSLISSSLSRILRVIIVKNSGKSMTPLPSASTYMTELAVKTKSTIMKIEDSHLVDHVLKLIFSRILTQTSHKGAELSAVDHTITI
jgi:hypothetical protein